MIPVSTMRGPHYVVTTEGSKPGSIRFVSRGKHRKLGDARSERDKLKPVMSPTVLSIYEIDWGKIPKFIE